MTEAFATVDMPVASEKRASLRCKVDTGAGGNVMPLRAFTKLFPNRLTKTGMPTGLRKCPIAIRPLVEKKLNKLLEQDVIVPVTEPTDWVSSLAYSWKADGDLRTCLEPHTSEQSYQTGPLQDTNTRRNHP